MHNTSVQDIEATNKTDACPGIARGGGGEGGGKMFSSKSVPCVCGTPTPLPRENFENILVFLYSGAF